MFELDISLKNKKRIPLLTQQETVSEIAGRTNGDKSRVTGRPFSCDKCDRAYKRLQHLNSHKRYECGVPPSFACGLCSYRAHQKSNLKFHMLKQHSRKLQ